MSVNTLEENDFESYPWKMKVIVKAGACTCEHQILVLLFKVGDPSRSVLHCLSSFYQIFCFAN